MSKNKRPTILVRRTTACGTQFGPYMVLKNGKNRIATCCATGVTVTLLCKSYRIQRGVSLPVSWTVLNEIIHGKQSCILHKIDRNYSDRLLDENYDYVMLYDCFGRNLFYTIDHVTASIITREPHIKVYLGHLIYENKKS